MNDKKAVTHRKKGSWKVNQNKGITLIALVVTIIVLLILAGISIAVLTGENGIILKAQESKEATELAQIKEEVIQKWYELEREVVDEFHDENTMARLFKEKLKNEKKPEDNYEIDVQYNSNNKTYEIKYKGYYLEIQPNGKVTNNREVAKKKVKDAWDKIKDNPAYTTNEAKFEQLVNDLGINPEQISIDNDGNIQITNYDGYNETITTGSNGETNVDIEEATYKDRASVEITDEPDDLELYTGAKATFKVTAQVTGDSSYQWYKTDRNSAIGGTPISGATSSTYEIASVSLDDNAYYYCEITSKYQGRTAKEKTVAAKLTVITQVDISGDQE